MNSQSTTLPRWLAGCALLTLCLVCALITGVGFYLSDSGVLQELPLLLADPSPTPFASPTTEATATGTPAATATSAGEAPRNPLFGGALPTALARDSAPPTPPLALAVPPTIIQSPAPPGSPQHLRALLEADFPVHDFFETSQRLGRYDVGPRTVTAPPYQVGDRQSFYIDDGETEAVLLAVTESTYFWAEESLNFDPASVQATAQRFEDDYYGRLVTMFGQEWRPGVDNDPRFSVLHLDYMDNTSDELGHFNSGDEYPSAFFSGSNQQEIVYLNMSNLTLGSDLYFGTLVHEFQHLSQWYVDPNESAWLNEGLSQLAEIYLGLETAETVDYLLAPDTRLNTWSYDEDVFAHYAASYLFCVYLWEQLGDAAIQELARHPANGLASVDAVLKGFRPDLSLEQLLADWVAANYLDDPAAGPQYNYNVFDLREVATTGAIKHFPQESMHTLEPFAAHYIELDAAGPVTISFAGDTVTRFLPTEPYSGETVWMAPGQDIINASLTRPFDLTGLNSATLTFWTWYDLKYDFDYGYITVSTDDGQTWELLDLSNNRQGEYGPALNGASQSEPGAQKGGWIQESISLDRFTGRNILLRFELLTYYDSDARGLAIDDIAIPELGYFHDTENGDDGWVAAGFVQVGAHLPQQWTVQLIEKGPSPRVTPIQLDAYNQASATFDIGPQGAALAVMPLTPFAVEPANYWIAVEP